MQIFNRKEADHDPTTEMVYFLTGHEPFITKLAQMNLKGSDKYTCDSEQTMKHLWELCPKNKLKYLRNMEPNLILQDKM